MGRDPRVEVELVEDAADHRDASTPAGAGATGSVPGDARPVRAPVRVRRRTLVAAGLTVVLGLAGTQAVLDARERALYARFADVTGVVAPLSADLGPLWRPDPGDLGVLWGQDEDAAGRRLGVRPDGSGAPEVVALDPRTGDVAWSARIGEPEELLAGTEDAPWVPCDLGADELLVCLVHADYRPGAPRDEPPGDGLAADVEAPDPPPEPTSSELVVLDARDGSVLRREPEQLGTAVLVLDDLVVTARVTDDRSLHVRGRDVRTGAEEWTWASAPGAVPPQHDPGRWVGSAWLTPLGDGVLAASGPTAVRLAADGTPEATYEPGADDEESSVDVARGHVVRHSMSGALHLLADDGTRTRLRGGFPAAFTVDDGSEPDLLLTYAPTGTGVDVWDTRTGTVRWSRDDVGLSDAVLLDGVAYVATQGGDVLALDLADGTTLWSTGRPGRGVALHGPLTPTMLTDGRVLALVEHRASGSAVLRAFEISGGTPAWTAELPAEVEGVNVIRDQVVGYRVETADVVVLG